MADDSVVSSAFLATPWPVEKLETVDSTSLEAHRRASDGVRGPLWIVADEQTAGKGRSGRAWVSKQGNLYSTALLPLNKLDKTVPVLALTIGLAVFDTVKLLSNGCILPGLKWPNDVRVNNAKISGILLETGSFNDGGLWLSIGIGINLVHSPEIEGYLTTNIANEGGPVVPTDQAIVCLDDRVRARMRQHFQAGTQSIIADWMAYSDQVGQRCRANARSGPVEGDFVGLDEIGQLLLRNDAGELITISAGDVNLIRETTHASGN